MARSSTLEHFNNLTPEQARAIVARIVKPTRRITGHEYEVTMTMLRLIEPYYCSNSQRFSTTCYKIGDKLYRLTDGDGISEPELEEVLDEN